MAQYLVIYPRGGDVPPLGLVTALDVFRVDAISEQAAVAAALGAWSLTNGTHLWVMPAAALGRYLVTATATPD